LAKADTAMTKNKLGKVVEVLVWIAALVVLAENIAL
jgi:hypothetical protein